MSLQFFFCLKSIWTVDWQAISWPRVVHSSVPHSKYSWLKFWTLVSGDKLAFVSCETGAKWSPRKYQDKGRRPCLSWKKERYQHYQYYLILSTVHRKGSKIYNARKYKKIGIYQMCTPVVHTPLRKGLLINFICSVSFASIHTFN